MPSASSPPPTSAWASCRRFDHERERAVRIALAGELDIASVVPVDRVLRCAEVDADLIVLDLRELWFMDCSGANLIVATDRRVRSAGRRLVVVRGPARVDWFFGLLGLERRLELVDDPPTGPAEADRLMSVAA